MGPNLEEVFQNSFPSFHPQGSLHFSSSLWRSFHRSNHRCLLLSGSQVAGQRTVSAFHGFTSVWNVSKHYSVFKKFGKGFFSLWGICVQINFCVPFRIDQSHCLKHEQIFLTFLGKQIHNKCAVKKAPKKMKFKIIKGFSISQISTIYSIKIRRGKWVLFHFCFNEIQKKFQSETIEKDQTILEFYFPV